MTTLIGVSGSLRRGSLNAALLRAAAGLMPEGAGLRIGTIRGIPLYDADAEAADGIPQPVRALKDAIAASDGLVLVTPEYNNSVPGVFKNAIDWLSRPAGDIARVFGAKPVAIMGTSPGNFGTLLSQNAHAVRAISPIPIVVRPNIAVLTISSSATVDPSANRSASAAPISELIAWTVPMTRIRTDATMA